MAKPRFSVIIPACDEEQFLPSCLGAIEQAAEKLGEPVEVVVVDNMSRDRTAAIAREHGAKVVQEPAKNLSIIRNRGVAASCGEFVVTIDADSRMSSNMLVAIRRVLESGRYIGGGVLHVRPDRLSLGIICSVVVFAFWALLYIRTSCTVFYTAREAFDAIGGFDESLYAVEDVDFGIRLRRLGRERGLRYKNMVRAYVVTSTRKFDEFGDWFVVFHPRTVWKVFHNDRAAAHDLWYRSRR